MLNSYIPLLIMLVIATVIGIVMAGLSFILGPKKPNAYKESSYECGMTPVGNARERFPIKFYLIAMLFIIFDIETVFLYPWAVTFRGLPQTLRIFELVEMAIFVIILFVGYFYILGKGALDWDESQQARSANVIGPEVLEARPRLNYGNENSGPVDLGKVPVGARVPAYGASSQEEMITTTARGA
jgi:NADH-quinone oxidoreductase subunit A